VAEDVTSVETETVAATAADEAPKTETTSDEPKTEAKAPDEAPTADGDKPKAAKDDDAPKPDDEEAAKASKKQSAQARINDLTRARREAERRAERAEKELADLRKKEAPDPSKYEDPDDLSNARLNHTLDQREAERKEAEAKAAKEDAETAVAEAWQERVSNFRETATDFDEVAYRAPVNDETAADIARLEEGPQIAYYLGKNPAEARALNNLSVRERAVELGRLANRLSTPPPRKTSQAPEPVKPVSGNGAQSSSFDPEKASMAEYIAKRKAGWG